MMTVIFYISLFGLIVSSFFIHPAIGFLALLILSGMYVFIFIPNRERHKMELELKKKINSALAGKSD